MDGVLLSFFCHLLLDNNNLSVNEKTVVAFAINIMDSQHMMIMFGPNTHAGLIYMDAPK